MTEALVSSPHGATVQLLLRVLQRELLPTAVLGCVL